MSTNRRKRPIKKNNKNTLSKEQNLIYLGICLFLLSFFLILFMTFENTGIVGRFVSSFLKGLFGWYGKLIPFTIMIISFILLFRKLREKKKTYIVHILILSILFMVFMDGVNVPFDNFKGHMSNTIEVASDFKGGGYIGAVISHPIRAFLGDTGLFIFLAVALLIELFSMFNLKKEQLVEGTEVCVNKIEEKISTGYSKIRERRPIINPDKPLRDKTKDASKIKDDFEKDIIFEDENDSFKETENRTPLINTYNEFPEDEKEVTIEKDVPQGKVEVPLFEEKIKTNEDTEAAQITMIDTNTNDKEIQKYEFPPISILKNSKKIKNINTSLLNEKAKIIEKTLASFGIDVTVENINRGPTVTVYELKPAVGVKISRIVNLQDDLCLALESRDIRIVAPIPGKSRVGIETPNDEKDVLSLREMLVSDEYKASSDKTSVALGKDIEGKNIITTISDMPHLLIAGATGSGKSVCINSIILSILYKAEPKDVKLLLIDPKVVELSVYNGIPHLLIPVVTDAKKASAALQWAVTEMEKRYALFAKNNARDIRGYNEKAELDDSMEKLKQIVIIIDELADLMLVSGKEVEESISRLAQMARAAGMYIIVATQRPSVDVITGTIKANIPSRISFAVSSQIDSRTILDMAGAEKLLGKGDMLFLHRSQSSPVRLQGPFVSDHEIEQVVKYIKENNYENQYNTNIQDEIKSGSTQSSVDGDFEDELFEDAALLVVKDNQGSISYLQRKLRIGYSRAARIIDQMEAMGIVGPSEGSKPRSVLVSLNELDEVLHKDEE